LNKGRHFFCHNDRIDFELRAEALVKPLLHRIVSVFLLPFVMVVGECPAENLPDPTRPPSALGPLPPAFGEEPENAPAPMPVLQSIMLSASRKAAMISGQMVTLGEKFGEARLVKLTSSEAVLRTEEGLQMLKLFPDVEKKVRLVPQEENMNRNKMKQRGAALGKKAK